MNKISLVLSIAIVILIAVFSTVLYKNASEIEKLKAAGTICAKENESLKIDTEMLKKRLAQMSEKNGAATKTYGFSEIQKGQIKAMKGEIERLKAEKKVDNREREEEVWDLLLTSVQDFVNVEMTKKLASLGFQSDETSACVTEYQNALAKTKDLMLQWYRNEISSEEYDEKFLNLTREFYKNMSNSIGENKASIAISIIIPDPEYRKKMFEE